MGKGVGCIDYYTKALKSKSIFINCKSFVLPRPTCTQSSSTPGLAGYTPGSQLPLVLGPILTLD